MADIFLKIVNMSISAGWIVLAVLLLRIVLKKAPKWITVLFWGIVAVRLVCPFSIESVFSLIPSTETINPEIMMDGIPEINTGIPVINNTLNHTLNPSLGGAFTPEPAAGANPLQMWISVLAVIWFVGMIALLTYTLISYWCLRRKVDTAVLLRENIFQSERVSSPFVFGIVKPKIYLPFGMCKQDAEHVIAHERAHIRRKDNWWKPLGFVLLALHWFNPLMWIGYVLLCRDIEFACDERVIKELNHEQKADYSQTLLSCSVNRRMISACPLAFGGLQVRRRVKSVLAYRKPAVSLVLAAVLAGGVVAVCFLTDPKVGADAPVSAPEDTSAPETDAEGPAIPDGSGGKPAGTPEEAQPGKESLADWMSANDRYSPEYERMLKMSLDEWLEAFGSYYPENERMFNYAVYHFHKEHLCNEALGVHTLECENAGTEDGSLMLYLTYYDKHRSYGSEVMTISLAAGEKKVLTFEHCFSYAVVQATYGDVSAEGMQNIQQQEQTEQMNFCYSHFSREELGKKDDDHLGTGIQYENRGTEDGSVTLYLLYYATDDVNAVGDPFGSEILTIPLPAGKTVTVTFDHYVHPCAVIGASYGDLSVQAPVNLWGEGIPYRVWQGS